MDNLPKKSRLAGIVFPLALSLPFFYWIFKKYINLDFWYDEAYTLINFIFVPLVKTAADYHVPNNHIFHNLLFNILFKSAGVKSVYLIEPFALRLIELLFSSAAVIILYKLMRRFVNQLSAVLSVIILTTTVPFFNFAVQIRGYALSVMLLTVIIYCLWALEEGVKKSGAIALTVSSALFVYTIPINIFLLFSILIHYLVRMAVEKGGKRSLKAIVSAVTASIALSAVLCFPVLREIRSHFAIAGEGLFNPDVLLRALPVAAVYFASGRLAVSLLVLGGIFVFVRNVNKEEYRNINQKCIFCISLLALPFFIHFLIGTAPFMRAFVVLLPVFSIFAALNIIILAGKRLEKAGRLLKTVCIITVFLYCNLTFASELNHIDLKIKNETLAYGRPQSLYANYYQAYYAPSELINDFVSRHHSDRVPVLVYEPRIEDLPHYYLRKNNISFRSLRDISSLSSFHEAHVITNQHLKFQERALAELPQVSCELLNKNVNFHRMFYCRRKDK